MNLIVFGGGYVGLPTAAVLSLKYNVTIVERQPEKVLMINNGISPFQEEGLEELLRKGIRNESLRAIELGEIDNNQDAAIICVGTPMNVDGSVDLRNLQEVVKSLMNLSFSKDYFLVALRSTVPPGTTRQYILEPLLTKYTLDTLGVVFSPEFLRQGNAVRDILEPDRIVVGATDPKAINMYVNLATSSLNKQVPILNMSIESAELCKYASNAFLATKVSFVNEIASLAETIPEINIDEVMEAMSADHRICGSHLRPGLGFGGSCLPKDLRGLILYSESKNITMPLLKAVEIVNENVTSRIINILKKHFDSLSGEKIAILGLAFKPNTDDSRDSPTLSLIHRLLPFEVDIWVHDPLAAFKDKIPEGLHYSQNILECTSDASVLILMTDWQMYYDFGIDNLTKHLRIKLVIDGRRMFTKASIPKSVTYYALGSYTNLENEYNEQN